MLLFDSSITTSFPHELKLISSLLRVVGVKVGALLRESQVFVWIGLMTFVKCHRHDRDVFGGRLTVC